jgi:hypothetical protein
MDNLDTRFLSVERHHIATKGGFLSKLEDVAYLGDASGKEAEVLLKDLLFDALDSYSDAQILDGTTVCCLVAYDSQDTNDTLAWLEGRVVTDGKIIDENDADIGAQLDRLISEFETPMGEGSVNGVEADLGVASFPDYDCFATVQCGVLSSSPMLADSASAHTWTEITAPESQAFLDQVNQHFNTRFAMEHFKDR